MAKDDFVAGSYVGLGLGIVAGSAIASMILVNARPSPEDAARWAGEGTHEPYPAEIAPDGKIIRWGWREKETD